MRACDKDRLQNAICEFVDNGEIVGMFVADFNIMLERCEVEAEPIEEQIREYLFKNNYTMRLIAEPTDRIDLQELEDRFGKYVRFVVEDMMSGEGKRWKE